MSEAKTVAIVGAGTVGLAAAAHALERGLSPIVLEAGDSVGHALRRWSHVQLFSPWADNIDRAASRLLAPTGWNSPEARGGQRAPRHWRDASGGQDCLRDAGRTGKGPRALCRQNRRGARRRTFGDRYSDRSRAPRGASAANPADLAVARQRSRKSLWRWRQ